MMKHSKLVAVVIVTLALWVPPATSPTVTPTAKPTSGAKTSAAPATMPSTSGAQPTPSPTAAASPGIKAQVMIRSTMFFEDPLSKAEHTTLTRAFYAQLVTTLGHTYGEGYSTDWEVDAIGVHIVNIVLPRSDSAVSRAEPTISYNVEGISNVMEHGHFWSTAPFAQKLFARDLQSTLRSLASYTPVFSSVVVSTYEWPLVPGDTLFTFGYVRPIANDTDEEDTGENAASGGGGGEDWSSMSIGTVMLLGLIFCVVAIPCLIAVLTYGECSHSQTEVPGRTDPNPVIFVEHVVDMIAEHQTAIGVAQLPPVQLTDSNTMFDGDMSMMENPTNPIVWNGHFETEVQSTRTT